MAKSIEQTRERPKSKQRKRKTKKAQRDPVIVLRQKKRRSNPFEPDGLIGDIVPTDDFEFDGWIGDLVSDDPFEPDGIHGDQSPTIAEADFLSIADGRYAGGGLSVAIELRVDFEDLGIISGDLFGVTPSGQRYLASFRTMPGQRVEREGDALWSVIFETDAGATLNGFIAIEKGRANGTVRIVLLVRGTIRGLPAWRPIELSAIWQSHSMRQLTVELEAENGTSPPPSYRQDGRDHTYLSVLEDAGIEANELSRITNIPRPSVGWGIRQLHGLMQATTAHSLNRPEWRQQLLWLGKSSRPGLLGIMFDHVGSLQRQGCAVFEKEIRRIVPRDPDRKVIQTTVHEIGHSLNLAHRFEEEVGRANSKSIMNYDWQFQGGGKRTEYWRQFDFTFDHDERAFLRHGPRNKVIPGGAPFHSVAYWEDDGAGFAERAPEMASSSLELKLETPKRRDGHIFEFGQPVLLSVQLKNKTEYPLKLSRNLLDPKTGFLKVSVRRMNQVACGRGHHQHFHPLYERCVDTEDKQTEIVASGAAIANNLNITFGSGGFTFAEPGMYEVHVTCALPSDASSPEIGKTIASSNSVRLFISYPVSREQELDAVDVLLRDDVGVFFALGGSEDLARASNDLEEIRKRRMHRKTIVSDPIAANIIRCKGIEAGRWSLGFSGTSFSEVDGDPRGAARYLGQLEKGQNAGLNVFDVETAKSTKLLLNKHKRKSRK